MSNLFRSWLAGPPNRQRIKKSKATTIDKVNNLIFSPARQSILHTLSIVHIHSKVQSYISILPEFKLLMLCFLFLLIPILLCQEISHSVLGSPFFQELWFLPTIMHVFSISLFLIEVWMNYILLVIFSDCSNSSKAKGSLFFRANVCFFLTLYSECGCST